MRSHSVDGAAFSTANPRLASLSDDGRDGTSSNKQQGREGGTHFLPNRPRRPGQLALTMMMTASTISSHPYSDTAGWP